MDPALTEPAEEDVDLLELFSALLAHWFLIGSCALLFAGLAGYYAFAVATPKFQSVAVFEMPASSGAPGISDLVPLAGLLGGGGSSDSTNVRDMILGRDFIVEIAGDLDFLDDPFYNTTLKPPSGLGVLLEKFGVITPKPPTDAKAIDSVVKSYRKNVNLDETDDGALIVLTVHTEPEVASTVANMIVEMVIRRDREATLSEQRSRIEYLSGELATAQIDLDEAVQLVQEFAVGKNIASAEELFLQSQQLVRLRDREKENSDRIDALNALRTFLKTPGMNEDTLDTLLRAHPSLQERETIVMLGEPRTPAAWFALVDEDIVKELDSLEIKLNQVRRSVTNVEEEAGLTAANAGELAQLERDVKVATATFEVITQQFKEQSLLSGFDLSEAKIFETAVPALDAATPKKAVLLVIGFFGGLVVGLSIALYRNISRGRVHSRRGLKNILGQQVRLFNREKLPSMRARKPLGVLKVAKKVSSPDQSALSFALNSECKPIVITASLKRDATGLAFMTAGQMIGPEEKTVIVDLLSQLTCTGEENGAYEVQNLEPNLDLAQPANEIDFGPRAAAQPDFLEELSDLLRQYDNKIILLSGVDQSNYLLSALARLEPLVVTAAKLGKTRTKEMKDLVSLLPPIRQNGDGVFVVC